MTEKQPLEESPNKKETAPQASGGPAPRSRVVRWVARLIVLVIVAAIVLVVWRVFFAGPRHPDNVVALSGRIEGDDSAIAPKTGGRIVEIRVREGDNVKSGDTIAVLDDTQIRAREDQARAALAAAQARQKSARDRIDVLQEQLRQSRLQGEQSKIDAQGRVHQAKSEVAAAESDLAQREAALRIALFDKEAYTRLAETGAVSERQGRQAASTAAQQEAAVAAATRRVESARGALAVAEASLQNPPIRAAEAAGIQKQTDQQRSEVESANAEIAQAQAQLAEAQANRQDLIVTAPFDGTIVTRAAEPGEVVTAGTAIVTLVDLTRVYLRGYVPEGQIGNVAINQPARIYLDSNPNQPVEAYVSRIDPQATFTPENTYFRDERVKQVVGVKLQLRAGFGLAKPGMPADGEILVGGDSWPEGTRKK